MRIDRPNARPFSNFWATLVRRSILLITGDNEAAQTVVVARGPDDRLDTPPAGMKGKRIVDVTGLKPTGVSEVKCIQQLDKLLKEAAAAEDVILLVPPIEAANDPHQGSLWADALKKAVAARELRCVCRVNAAAYQRWIRKDCEWKEHAQVMWIHEARTNGIPDEL